MKPSYFGGIDGPADRFPPQLSLASKKKPAWINGLNASCASHLFTGYFDPNDKIDFLVFGKGCTTHRVLNGTAQLITAPLPYNAGTI